MELVQRVRGEYMEMPGTFVVCREEDIWTGRRVRRSSAFVAWRVE
jgi:hypothetical protein